MIKIAVVTGCASFLGTTFTAKLLEEGWYVYGIDKLTYVANGNIVKNFENKYPKFKLIARYQCFRGMTTAVPAHLVHSLN